MKCRLVERIGEILCVTHTLAVGSDSDHEACSGFYPGENKPVSP